MPACEPLGMRLVVMHQDLERHRRVPGAAVLRALSADAAAAVGTQAQPVHAAGDGIDLAAQARDQKEWMTSALVIRNSTRRPRGIDSTSSDWPTSSPASS